MATVTIADIRKNHPMPWSRVVHPQGLIQLFDGNGVEVPLFVMLDFIELTTYAIARQQAA